MKERGDELPEHMTRLAGWILGQLRTARGGVGEAMDVEAAGDQAEAAEDSQTELMRKRRAEAVAARQVCQAWLYSVVNPE